MRASVMGRLNIKICLPINVYASFRQLHGIYILRNERDQPL